METTIFIYLHGKTQETHGVDAVEFEVDCIISYIISGGQEGIFHLAPENCQPHYEPDCILELESAFIGYGDIKYPITRESRWWDIIEEELNNSESIIDECFEHARDLAQCEEY